MRRPFFLAILLLGAAAPLRADVPVTLRGSPESMERQHRIAREHGLTFGRTPGDVAAMEARGELVRLVPNGDFELREGLSDPLAHPVVRVFVERTAAGYRAACGEPLVVTSLTRAQSRQPRNSHPLSVHPTGIAVDLRVSRSAACRGWLEGSVLALEALGVLDITRENRPPHYHVALFPDAYLAHLEEIEGTRIREVPAVEESRLLPPAALARLAPSSAVEAERAVARFSTAPDRRAPGRGWLAAALLPLALVAGGVVHRRRG